MKDLSTVEGTITQRVETLISQMERMQLADIKISFQEIIIDSEKTSASTVTRQKWLDAMDHKRTKNDLMLMISNLYLAGCNLSTHVK